MSVLYRVEEARERVIPSLSWMKTFVHTVCLVKKLSPFPFVQDLVQ